MKHKLILVLALALVAAFAFSKPGSADTNSIVTVTNCNDDSELRNTLFNFQISSGLTIDFNCGIKTITLSGPLPDISHPVVINGGNKITLNGNQGGRILYVQATGTLTMKNIILEKGNAGNSFGGAIFNSGPLTIENATLRDNSANMDGGAIAAYNTLIIRNSTFTNNSAGYGGAIYANPAFASFQILISDSKFVGNTGADNKWGGAINTSAKFTIERTAFQNNSAGSGGAIYSNHMSLESVIADSTFSRNHATGSAPNANGGAVWLEQGKLTVYRSTFNENSADAGGAVHVMPLGEFQTIDSTFEKNQAASGGGGALYNKGKALVKQSTLSTNKAGGGGAGIQNYGTLDLYNATLSGNTGVWGAGLAHDGGTATVIHTTFEKNSAAAAGGNIYVGNTGSPSLSLISTIVADSVTNGNCYLLTVPAALEANLSSDDTCQFGTGRDNLDLFLGPLANNGGLTKTHMPLAGSPAIDNGVASILNTDQRGVSRPQGSGYDVGAVEVNCAKPTKPFLLKPKNNGAVKTSTVKLDWQDTQCATTYKVILKLGSKSGTLVQKKNGLAVSEFTTGTLSKGQIYVWRVIAINTAGKTKSDWWTFKTK